MERSAHGGLAWPSDEQIARAVETLAAIAAVESLQGGVVEFEAEDLTGGRWYEPAEQSDSLLVVWTPVPLMAPREQLLESCREQIELALEDRQQEIARAAFDFADRDQATGVQLGLELMYE